MRKRGRAERLLQFLADHPAGQSTPQLAALIRGEVRPWQAALTRAGGIMRRQEAAGHVRRAGKVPGSYQQGPAVIWQITEAGAGYLARRQAGRERRKRGTMNGYDERHWTTWMCGPCWQQVAADDAETPPACPSCGRRAQRPGDVKPWTDEEWSARTGLPVSERGGMAAILRGEPKALEAG